MEDSAAKIQCPNPDCQAFNPQDNQFCQQCRTPIVKRYLRVREEGVSVHQVGDLLGDRYLLKQPQVVLDTKPGLPPEIPKDVPDDILSYLRLFPYRLHIPQVYGYLPHWSEEADSGSWLLEYGTVPLDSTGELLYPELLPELSQMWPQANALRQLNWLWQIVQLWQPLQRQGAVSSLLKPSLWRVNGALVQLLELQPDISYQVPNFKQFGQLWLNNKALALCLSQSSPNLARFWRQLCQSLQQGKISRPEQLSAILEGSMRHLARSHLSYSYQIVTCSDIGQSRKNNEDACYPPTDRLVSATGGKDTLAIVCDGLGGMEKGEVASQMAIDILTEEIDKLSWEQNGEPEAIAQALEAATCVANDAISQRNDAERRRDRARMGTTLVLSLAHTPTIYLTHVGDSRIYWVRQGACHQVTVDDDLASREVRLGYGFYHQVSRYPGSGSLVQALGMSSSATLHPTVGRLIVDEDCLFLLCSDGLSDFDRVEQYWESELVPILQHSTDLATAAKRLLDMAKQQNGHDNITFALVYCQVQPTAEKENNAFSLAEFPSLLPNAFPGRQQKLDKSALETTPDLAASQVSRRSGKLILLAIALGLLAILGGGYWLISTRQQRGDSPSTNTPESPATINLPTLAVADLITIKEAIAVYPSLGDRQQLRQVPAGSILQVVATEADSSWLLLQVCQLPPDLANLESLSGQKLLSPREKGWISAQEIQQAILPNWQPNPAQVSHCTNLE